MDNISQQIQDKLSQVKPQSAYEEVVAYLRQFAANIATGASPLAVSAQPSFRANIGQQWQVVVRVPGTTVQQVLFKVYVPIDGFPVTVDLYGEETQQYADLASLEQALEQFAVDDATIGLLAELRRLAEPA